MTTSIDNPPLYDPIVTQRMTLSPIWSDWFSTFVQTLSSYVSDSGIFIPKLNSTQRDAIQTPQEGQMIYNSSIPAPQIYLKGAWKTFTVV